MNPIPAPLEDSFGRKHGYLRLSLTDRCNFRCTYCMPEAGVEWLPKSELLTFEEIERLVRLFVSLGVSKLRLTGGEPTLRQGYLDLVARLSAIDGLTEFGITTNGFRLAKDAETLARNGLTSVNVSLDSLRADRFKQITLQDGHEKVLAGIQAAVQAGLETKVNVVVLPGINDDELLDFVEFSRENPVTVRFIEFMPFLANNWQHSEVLPSAELRARILTQFPIKALPNAPEAVATDYEVPGFAGRIAFVSSVTESFCKGCNRVRVTANGQVKSCLFLPPMTSLRDLMREGCDDSGITLAIQQCLQSKWEQHPPMTNWAQRDHLTMVQIGG